MQLTKPSDFDYKVVKQAYGFYHIEKLSKKHKNLKWHFHARVFTKWYADSACKRLNALSSGTD